MLATRCYWQTDRRPLNSMPKRTDISKMMMVIMLMANCCLAQNVPGEEQISEYSHPLVFQQRFHGTIYCPDEKPSSAELSLIPDGFKRSCKECFFKTTTNDRGEFVVEKVEPGFYRLIVRNSCAGDVSAVHKIRIAIKDGNCDAAREATIRLQKKRTRVIVTDVEPCIIM